MKFIDPYHVSGQELPLIVLSDNTSGFVAWAIKWRTKSNWNHIMFMHEKGKFASQGNRFSAVGLKRYMSSKSRLKFWKIKGITNSQKQIVLNSINDNLKDPKTKYDWLGVILGQGLGLPFINNPVKNYCSENVAKHLSLIIKGIPEHPSPKDLNEFFKDNPYHFKVHGRWVAD